MSVYLDHITFKLRSQLSMLMRWAEALAHRGATNVEIEQEAWNGVQDVLSNVREGVIAIERATTAKGGAL